jgi:hypothetical protein
MPAPTFAKVGRGQQALDKAVVGGWIVMLDEFMHLFGRREKAQQIEVKPPDERGTIRFGRRRDLFLFEPRQDEGIDGIADCKLKIAGFGNGGTLGRFEGPVLEARAPSGSGSLGQSAP